MLFLKLSIGYFFLRLLILPAQRRVVYAVMILSTISNATLSIFDLFLCGNPKNFPVKVLSLQCVDTHTQEISAYLTAAINTVTDLTFAILPFWLLNNSMMPKRVKMYVFAILGLATM